MKLTVRACVLVAMLLVGNVAIAQVSLRPVIGGFPADAGFAAGGQIGKTKLIGPVNARIRAVGSIKKYELLQTWFEIPELGERYALTVSGRYHRYPQEDFWGIGPNIPKDQRANYLLEAVDTWTTFSVFAGKFSGGATAGFLKINTGPGRDTQFPSVPESLQTSPRYKYVTLTTEYNSTDEESDPHKGGRYSVRWTAYTSSFHRYVVDLSHFFPVTATDRIGVRLMTAFTHSSSSDAVPFFMLPGVGGSESVRGYHYLRFRDRNALVMNAEYRRPLNGLLDVVGFVDAGRVFAKPQNLGLTNLHFGSGGGVRLKFGQRMLFGVDVGVSKDGPRLYFRSEHAF